MRRKKKKVAQEKDSVAKDPNFEWKEPVFPYLGATMLLFAFLIVVGLFISKKGMLPDSGPAQPRLSGPR